VTRSFSVASAVRGALLAVAGHGVVILAAFVAARFIEPSGGGGMQDLAAVATVLVVGEITLLLACLIGGIVSLVRRRPDLAVGLFAGWLLGALLLRQLVMVS
jgi:hypothetical protein